MGMLAKEICLRLGHHSRKFFSRRSPVRPKNTADVPVLGKSVISYFRGIVFVLGKSNTCGG